ncbi:MAG: siderophore biosynthesis PLP-dependent protein [Methylotenera sp.]|nr:MAG: siderophore biosynthesis PLP-dependent protein [Methylotenera sp.]
MELRWNKLTAYFQQLAHGNTEPISAYVYDLEALRLHATHIVNSLPPAYELFYAIKANSDLPILETLAPIVHGFEVSSGGELSWVRQHFPQQDVIFSGPGKTDRELLLAVKSNAGAIHVESMGELQRLGLIAEGEKRVVSILLRINLQLQNLSSTSLMMGGGPTPFGIAADQLPDCIEWLRSHPELNMQGFHLHLLSHQLNAVAHLEILEAYLLQARQWARYYDIAIDHINVGGGIGINYREPDKQFDWALFGAGLRSLADLYADGPRIRFECGRYITAACGYYAMQVIDIKQAFGKTYLVARGGTHQFRTPYAQGHSHPFRVMAVEHWPYSFTRPQIEGLPVTIVGQLCTPKDVLAYDAEIERVRSNDLVVFPYAGAYAWHISHHDFLRHPHPEHHYLPIEA